MPFNCYCSTVGSSGCSFAVAAMRQMNSLLPLTLLCLVGSTLVACIDFNKVPHISQCNYCQECLTNIAPSDGDGLLGVDESPVAQSSGRLHVGMFAPSELDLHMRLQRPNCTQCWGCNTKLTGFDKGLQVFGRTYLNRLGLSRAWVFKATSSPKEVVPDSVVKMLCVPLDKRNPARSMECTTSRAAPALVVRMLRAIELLSQECGVTDVVVKAWAAKVRAVIPGVGYQLNWHGLWMDLVKGVSIPSLVAGGYPTPLQPEIIADLLTHKLNGTQILLGAIFDLLTSQCDRHPYNVLITEQGHIKLIDNDIVLQDRWPECGFFSVFLPITQMDWNTEPKQVDTVTPLCVLDYRCHIPGGKAELGTNYPPQITMCLARISGQSVDQIQQHYGIERLAARNLHQRATDMLTKGFEWTLRYGEPQNAPELRYHHPHKCCGIRWSKDTGRYHCIRDLNR